MVMPPNYECCTEVMTGAKSRFAAAWSAADSDDLTQWHGLRNGSELAEPHKLP